MALDFYLAKYAQEAGSVAPSFSLEFKEHEFMFAQVKRVQNTYPLVMRFSDYYGDTKFGCQELQGLIAEIEEIKKQSLAHPHTLLLFSKLAVFCKIALNKGLSIWVFCD